IAAAGESKVSKDSPVVVEWDTGKLGTGLLASVMLGRYACSHPWEFWYVPTMSVMTARMYSPCPALATMLSEATLCACVCVRVRVCVPVSVCGCDAASAVGGIPVRWYPCHVVRWRLTVCPCALLLDSDAD